MVDAQVANVWLEAERDRLLEVRRRLVADAFDERESAGELSSLDQHQADVGSEVFEREKERAILNRVDADLGEVADAFVRLDRGAYGICQTCDVPIPDERLEAASAGDIAAREAARHLEVLPTDDESDTVEQLGPEEQALHTTYLGTRMSEVLELAEVELAEMQDAGVQSDERIEAQREEDSRRAETEVLIVEEEELSEASSSRRQPWLWRRRRRSVAGR